MWLRPLLVGLKYLEHCNGAQKSLYQKYKNNVESVQLWIQRNLEQVFFYQEEKGRGLMKGPLTGTNMSFVIEIQNDFQFKMMIAHGHSSATSLDATFGTNENKVKYYLVVPFVDNVWCILLPTILFFPCTSQS